MEDEKKRSAAAGNIGRLKQLHDKTTAVTKKYDTANNVKTKAQNGYRSFKSGEVQPTPSTAPQQAGVRMAPHTTAPLQASTVTMKITVTVVVVTGIAIALVSAGVTYTLSKCSGTKGSPAPTGKIECGSLRL